jgi:hypothetical protein
MKTIPVVQIVTGCLTMPFALFGFVALRVLTAPLYEQQPPAYIDDLVLLSNALFFVVFGMGMMFLGCGIQIRRKPIGQYGSCSTTRKSLCHA